LETPQNVFTEVSRGLRNRLGDGCRVGAAQAVQLSVLRWQVESVCALSVISCHNVRLGPHRCGCTSLLLHICSAAAAQVRVADASGMRAVPCPNKCRQRSRAVQEVVVVLYTGRACHQHPAEPVLLPQNGPHIGLTRECGVAHNTPAFPPMMVHCTSDVGTAQLYGRRKVVYTSRHIGWRQHRGSKFERRLCHTQV
jgi:hypothetical protein